MSWKHCKHIYITISTLIDVFFSKYHFTKYVNCSKLVKNIKKILRSVTNDLHDTVTRVHLNYCLVLIKVMFYLTWCY